VQGWQVFGFLYGAFRAAQNGLGAEVGQGFRPQFFRLGEQLGIAEGGVILVVVVDTKQGKNLVDGIDQVAAQGCPGVGADGGFSLPSCGR